MHRYEYEDYLEDELSRKEKGNASQGKGNCEMSEQLGWGESNHTGTYQVSGTVDTIFSWFKSKKTKG